MLLSVNANYNSAVWFSCGKRSGTGLQGEICNLCSDTTTPAFLQSCKKMQSEENVHAHSFLEICYKLFLTVCRRCRGTLRNTAQGWHRSWTCVKSYCTTVMPAPRKLGATPYSSLPEGWNGAGGISVPCPWRGGWSQWLSETIIISTS